MKARVHCIFALLMVALPVRAETSAEGVEFFERKIRPLLVEQCYKCHSAEAEKVKGGLLLDSREGLLKGGDTGAAVVGGDVEKSLIIEAVRYQNEDLQMPPKKKLSEQQIKDLEAWVKLGAPFPPSDSVKRQAAGGNSFDLKERAKHWAFQPLIRADVPKVKDAGWVRSPIDAFVLAKLEAQGLRPAREADRRTLIRRVTFDLIGLPPTVEEIEAFLKDESAGAFERVVERLLASPHYGERWGRHWLDLVRYAETAGHEFDFDMPLAYEYRDYVIRAMNADLPYDQFVVEHVAGDLLKEPRRHPVEKFNESIIGTGFWFLGESVHSPVDVREDEALRVDNQIDVFAKAFQGLTVACARCHDHKFDAISTKDYYALAGYVQSSRYQEAFVDAEGRIGEYVGELEALRRKIAASVKVPDTACEQAVPPEGTVVFENFDGESYSDWFVTGQAFGVGPVRDGEVRVDGDSVTAPPRGTAHSGRVSKRLEGALRSRTFEITKKKIWYRMSGDGATVNLIIDGFQKIRAPIYGGLKIKVAERKPKWFVQDVGEWVGHRAYIEFLDEGEEQICVDEVWFSDGGKPPTVEAAEEPGVAIAGEASESIEEYKRIERKIPKPRRVMAMADGTGENERVFIRGNHKTLGEEVSRRFLEAVCGADQPTPSEGSGRLELARRMVDAGRNPLLARVMVNRIWKHHFGEGIVRSPDDFGVMGQAPTHPELLDYFAGEFVRRGWSIKAMHRMMVLSSAYRMSSRAEEKALAVDPQNKLLHHMPVRRLEAEAIRDSILAVSGRLDRTMYGPSVMPHLTAFMQGRGRPGESGPLDGKGRRSIYVNVRRNFLTPMFLSFDYPIPFTTVGRRNVSNVPAQALVMMNNPFVVKQAELWGKRVVERAGTVEERVGRLYEEAFARRPEEGEVRAAVAFLEEQGRQYGSESWRAWADLCHVLMNVKEFVFVN